MTKPTSARSPKSPSFRPELLHLEDRLAPGEVLQTAMLWSFGPIAFPALLGQVTPGGEITAGTPGSAPAAPDDTFKAETPVPSATGSLVTGSSTIDGGTVLFSATSHDTGSTDDESGFATTAAGTEVGADTGPVPSWAAPETFADGSAAPTQESSAGTGAAATGGSSVAAATPPTSGGTGPVAVAPTAATGAARATVAPVTEAPAAAGTLMSGVSVTGGGDSGAATPEANARRVAAPDAGGGFKPLGANGSSPFSPAQIRQAYGFNQVGNQGAGQTIYIVDAYNDPNLASDLQKFDTQWGLPAANLTVHKMTASVGNDTGWGQEESLDVEWAHAIAPQANLVLVEAPSAYTSDLFNAVDWATNNGAHIVSMSWGLSDASYETSLDSHFNHTGVSYVASAGDAGGVVNYPAASPYVLSVGGTSLTLTTANAYSSEKAWSSGGGGASRYESEPGYQTNYGIKGGKRATPDVAYDADPNTGFYVYDSYYSGGGGWFSMGGTSAGAPQWAALIALADQGRSTPLSTNNLTTRSEYSAAATAIYSSNYHDVTTGSDGYAAAAGFDLATGLGTPKANTLVPWLIAHG